MQYETIFDVANSYPRHWSGLWFGAGVAALFFMARFRQAVLEKPELRQEVLAWIPRRIWPRLLRPYVEFLLEMLVLSIIEIAILMSPRWYWGVLAGLAIFGLGVWRVQSDERQIMALQNPGSVERVEGAVTKIGSYMSNGRRRGFIAAGGHSFDYGSDDAGSPFLPTNRVIFQGQNVRLTYVGDHIIKVERQLCLTYARCTVTYILGIRLELDAS